MRDDNSCFTKEYANRISQIAFKVAEFKEAMILQVLMKFTDFDPSFPEDFKKRHHLEIITTCNTPDRGHLCIDGKCFGVFVGDYSSFNSPVRWEQPPETQEALIRSLGEPPSRFGPVGIMVRTPVVPSMSKQSTPQQAKAADIRNRLRDVLQLGLEPRDDFLNEIYEFLKEIAGDAP